MVSMQAKPIKIHVHSLGSPVMSSGAGTLGVSGGEPGCAGQDGVTLRRLAGGVQGSLLPVRSGVQVEVNPPVWGLRRRKFHMLWVY